MSIRSIIVAAILVTSLLSPLTAGAVVPSGNPVEIPVVIPTTGTAAFLGTEMAQALVLIERDANATGGIRGRPVKFKVVDEQSNPTVAVQVVTQALADSCPRRDKVNPPSPG